MTKLDMYGYAPLLLCAFFFLAHNCRNFDEYDLARPSISRDCIIKIESQGNIIVCYPKSRTNYRCQPSP